MSGFDGFQGTLMRVLVAVSMLQCLAAAQYWFQSGAQGTYQSEYNSGASVQIQTITGQNPVSGSFGYWVGETISNGGFVQVGYEIPNQSGYYPTGCSTGGCTGKVLLQAGQPTWFWEYFPPGPDNNTFLGSIGPSDSVGANGTWNTYSFKAVGNVWYFYLNGQQIGSVDMGASNSGPHTPIAIAEYAEAETNTTLMPIVQFMNLEYYNGLSYRVLPKGLSLISYGADSAKGLGNPYGVREVGSHVDWFEVGSGIPVAPSFQLWSIGYRLGIQSQYGGINSSINYTPYSQVNITAPSFVNISGTERVHFAGWDGSGIGSYTGPVQNATVVMNGNITERAQWRLQYLLNVTSQYGNVQGAGWQYEYTHTNVSVDTNDIVVGSGRRAVFDGWSNGGTNTTFGVFVTGPMNTSAKWRYEDLVNATSPYGTVTGGGWYPQNSTATLTLDTTSVQAGPGVRYVFVGWSNGSGDNTTMRISVSQPTLISAIFHKEYEVGLEFTDYYGRRIAVNYVSLDNTTYPGSSVFVDPLSNNTLEYANYKGTNITADYGIRGVVAPGNVTIALPVYNVTITTKDLLDLAVNSSLNLTFRNGTVLHLWTGSNGIITIPDVPYGYVRGLASFAGQAQEVDVVNGGNVAIIFVSPLELVPIVVVIVLAFAFEKYHFRKGNRGKPRSREKGRGDWR